MKLPGEQAGDIHILDNIDLLRHKLLYNQVASIAAGPKLVALTISTTSTTYRCIIVYIWFT